jgi:hypothetical protein
MNVTEIKCVGHEIRNAAETGRAGHERSAKCTRGSREGGPLEARCIRDLEHQPAQKRFECENVEGERKREREKERKRKRARESERERERARDR